MRAPRLLVSDEAREVIVREAALYCDVETGGILMGRFEPADAIHVTHASGPGPNAVHEPAFFMRDTAYCSRVLSEHYERFGADYVGEWHTHVDGLRVPSAGDLVTLANIMHDPDYDFESFAMLLAVKFRRRRSRLELHAFVATKNVIMQSAVEGLATRKSEG